MKKRFAALLILPLAALATAAVQGKINFRDKARNMTLSNFASTRVQFVKDKIEFSGTGSPLQGSWQQQGLTVNASEIKGIAVKDAQGRFGLQSATMSGGVTAVITRQATGGAAQKITVTGDAMTFSNAADQGKLDIDRDVVITSTEAGSKMVATGSSGLVVIPPLGSGGEYRTAALAGPVKLTLTRTAPQASTIVATGSRLDINNMSKPPTATLSGNVHIEGSDPVFEGEVDASRAIITLNERNEIQSIDIIGEPAVATLNPDKKTSGGGGKRR